LFFEESVAGNEEPVVQLVPASEQARDFRRSVIDVITSLSAIENRHPVEVLNEILPRAAQEQSASANGPNHATVETASSGPEAISSR
jgi:hypothetical protein